MFERRLRFMLGFFGLAAVTVFGRLAHLQIVHGDYYRQQAQDALELPPTMLPFVRGSIMDRGGDVLVSDEPAWNLTIDFPIIALRFEPSDAALRREYRRWRKKLKDDSLSGETAQAAMELHLDRMWQDLETFCRRCGRDPEDVLTHARGVFEQIRSLREAVAAHRGFDAPVAEESAPHAVLTELSADEQIAAREMFAAYPWVHVDASSYRRYASNSTEFAHVLGRMGAVDADAVRNDPHADDPFARYLAGEEIGIAGVEWAAESQLRGRRGQVWRDREGRIKEDLAAENGASVRMTIVGELQRRLYHMLGSAVKDHPDSNGGAIVVLDVDTREVLALVSFPSYDPEQFREEYESLRDDTERLPLLFRAVATRYQPGSTIKPLACLSGYFHSVITPETLDECRGALFPDKPDGWRCWEIHGTSMRKTHGLINVEQALTGSCNVFMYRLGEKLGVDRLCSTFEMAGIGRPSGVGLREDDSGINPTSSWLMRNKNSPATAGLARQFAIGQAELSMTPIQVANMMATYANGKFRPATLFMGGQPSPEWTLPGSQAEWASIRRGIYGVVNDSEGTAHEYAHFVHDRYALCGKTGSATAKARPTAYRVPYWDEYHVERSEFIREGAKGPALDRFRKRHPLATFDVDRVEVATRWPPDAPAEGGNHAHAWFAGYLQRIDSEGRPDWTQVPKVAFAALVEFGGSGGRTSGPLARDIAGVLLEVLGPNLDAHRTEAVR